MILHPNSSRYNNCCPIFIWGEIKMNRFNSISFLIITIGNLVFSTREKATGSSACDIEEYLGGNPIA